MRKCIFFHGTENLSAPMLTHYTIYIFIHGWPMDGLEFGEREKEEKVKLQFVCYPRFSEVSVLELRTCESFADIMIHKSHHKME